jgi:hypothetical protein
MPLYVYYRVRVADAECALAALEALALSPAPELLRRRETRDGFQTWMEIYPDRLACAEPRVAAVLQPWIEGDRHHEQFEPLSQRHMGGDPPGSRVTPL